MTICYTDILMSRYIINILLPTVLLEISMYMYHRCHLLSGFNMNDNYILHIEINKNNAFKTNNNYVSRDFPKIHFVNG